MDISDITCPRIKKLPLVSASDPSEIKVLSEFVDVILMCHISVAQNMIPSVKNFDIFVKSMPDKVHCPGRVIVVLCSLERHVSLTVPRPVIHSFF